MTLETTLNLNTNLRDCDDVYEALINAHEGLSNADSAKLNAKLILLLFNHIGEPSVIVEAIKRAKA